MQFEIFIIRLILSIGFAILLTRFFRFLGSSIWIVGGLAILMMALAYALEYSKKR